MFSAILYDTEININVTEEWIYLHFVLIMSLILIFVNSIKSLLKAQRIYDELIQIIISKNEYLTFPLVTITTVNQQKIEGKIENYFDEKIITIITNEKVIFLKWDEVITVEIQCNEIDKLL
jgi:hypothetical protein